jgi:phage/plasmid-like protein (TIGR03299 family)
VCDNTRSAALGETGQQIKIKHTKNSELKLADAREALELVHDVADEVAAEIKALCEIEVSDAQWFDFLDAFSPVDLSKSKGAQTMADNKREQLTAMYRFDKRAATWRGTAFGVVQAVDTWTQHESIVRGQTRAEKNMMSVITGAITKTDRQALDALKLVLA